MSATITNADQYHEILESVQQTLSPAPSSKYQITMTKLLLRRVPHANYYGNDLKWPTNKAGLIRTGLGLNHIGSLGTGATAASEC